MSPKTENPKPKPKRTWRSIREDLVDFLLKIVVVCVLATPVVMLLSPIVYIPCYRASLKGVEFTVERRERVTTGSGDSVRSYYLVWSREGEVFCVTDTWSFFRFDSSDRYGKLDEGKKVKAQVAGWRVPFLSWYRNVVIIDDVASKES